MPDAFLKIAVAANGAGSGKDFIATGFEKTNRLQRIGFADPIKRMVGTALGVPWQVVDQLKVGMVTPPARASLAPEMRDLSDDEIKRRMRIVLQMIGTDVFRVHWCDTHWIHHLVSTVEYLERHYKDGNALTRRADDVPPVPGVVVTDVRFPNEFNALRHAGFYMVDLDAPAEFKHIKPGTPEYDHPSERALDEYRKQGLFDQRLWNDRTLGAYDLALEVINAIIAKRNKGEWPK
jgi:hypothetical protein